MKKISFILLLFITVNSFAQKISPYFPDPFLTSSSNKYQTQISYFDLNFVTLKLQDYMSYKFLMTLNDEKTKYELNEGKGDITFAFIDKMAINKKPRELFFKYSVFPLEKELVITELKITGDTDTVLRFYIDFWTTTLNFDDVSKTETVSNRLFQDRISYSYNNGNSYVTVKNTTIENPEEFITEYEAKKVEFDKNEKIRIAQKEIEEKERAKRLEEEQKIKEKERNTQITKVKYQVIKKKRNLKFEKTNKYFPDKHSEEANLKSRFNEFLAEKEKGTYIIEVQYKLVYKELTDINFEIISYTKPKGILDVVGETIKY